MPTLTVTSSSNYSGKLLLNINSVVFSTPPGGYYSALFSTDQFGPLVSLPPLPGVPGLHLNGISNALNITGDINLDIFAVYMPAPGSFSAAAWTFTNWASMDLVELTGTSGNDTITGSSVKDSIFAGEGGVDTLSGGNGDDEFGGLATHPFGTYDGGDGFDDIVVVHTGVTYSLADLTIRNVEQFQFYGDDITAHLTGGQIGAAAAGAITSVKSITSGDALVVDGDHVDLTSVTFDLVHPLSVTINASGLYEATLTGSSQDDTINGGSSLHDTINGGFGNDTMNGGGGADTFDGGDGVDTVVYVTSPYGVQVNLATGIGAGGDAEGDTLTHVENLTGSRSADVLIGDAGDNTLLGGDGNDDLTGAGGRDHLDGGKGVDTAHYDASPAGVQVDLAAGTGTGGDADGDTLVSIRNVVGSAFADVLTGNVHNNTLFGGAGIDYLTGGGGADTFVFTTAPDTVSNVDIITDFLPGTDVMELDDAVFPGLTPGTLSAGAFVVGTAAADADDRIVYEQSIGALLFDADGNGAGAAVQFAAVTPGLVLTFTDFVVI